MAVLEKREGPAPLAAFKVGESTVACGAHYFPKVVGMRDHLQKDQLIEDRAGVLFPARRQRGHHARIEPGAPFFPPHDNLQLDRGLFENELAARARA